MTERKITIYVGMALTEAPPEFRDDFQTELKSQLRALPDVRVLDFIGLENGTALDVYKHDKMCTETADLCVFVVDHTSTGLGMEIMLRAETQKTCLFFARKEQRITRMLLGFLSSKSWPLHRYSVAREISEVVHSQCLHQTGQRWP